MHYVTDGINACMDPSHIAYGVKFDYENDTAVPSGARLRLDDHGANCGFGATIAVGHLQSKDYFLYGDFEWRARIHHNPVDGGAPPSNSFTCLAAYTHDPQHNELAWCFPSANGKEVHASYWYDDVMHRSIFYVDSDLTQRLHTFKTIWRGDGADWLIDGRVVHQTRGEPGKTVPWLPMSMRIILRPNNKHPTAFLGAQSWTSSMPHTRRRRSPASGYRHRYRRRRRRRHCHHRRRCRLRLVHRRECQRLSRRRIHHPNPRHPLRRLAPVRRLLPRYRHHLHSRRRCRSRRRRHHCRRSHSPSPRSTFNREQTWHTPHRACFNGRDRCCS